MHVTGCESTHVVPYYVYRWRLGRLHSYWRTHDEECTAWRCGPVHSYAIAPPGASRQKSAVHGYQLLQPAQHLGPGFSHLPTRGTCCACSVRHYTDHEAKQFSGCVLWRVWSTGKRCVPRTGT